MTNSYETKKRKVYDIKIDLATTTRTHTHKHRILNTPPHQKPYEKCTTIHTQKHTTYNLPTSIPCV